MQIRQFVVDAFTAQPFRGNPAAIVVLDAPVPAGWMQALAAENNLSETAYLWPVEGGWSLRWFTPTVEVDLCGHATIAAAHVLTAELPAEMPAEITAASRAGAVRFATASGWLGATARTDGWIELDFPADPPVVCPPPAGLLEALGVEGADGGSVVEVARGRSDLLVRVSSTAAVRACRPDHRALRALDVRGVTVTAATEAAPGGPAPSHDIESRFFAPGSGIDEDPVTGSAHCTLAPFWAERLGRTSLHAYQASARGGDVRTELRGDRVALAGQAVTVARATLTAAAGPGPGEPTDPT